MARKGKRMSSEDWAERLVWDAEALEACVKREEKRGRSFRGMEVSEVQQVLTDHAPIFARVIHARRKLLTLLDTSGKKMGGGGGSGGGGSYVVRHKQEGHVPEALVTMYEALWIKAYGSGASYIGDPNSLTPLKAGGNQMQMGGSEERVHRGVAKESKDRGGGRKSVIKDERAFEFKRKMDKRMRRMASEIEEWIRSEKVHGVDVLGVGESQEVAPPRCEGCQSFVDREWRFCARCGVRR